MCTMIATDVIAYLAEYAPGTTLIAQNEAGNTPLHWAALNGHLDTVKRLVDIIDFTATTTNLSHASLQSRPEEDPGAPAPPAWDIRNAAGRGPMTEAEMAGKQEVVQFLLERSIVGANQQGVTHDDHPDAQEDDEEEIPAEDSETKIPPSTTPSTDQA